MSFSLRFVAVLSVALLACGTPKPPCTASTCLGCCDATGACQGGSAANACGSAGAACATCQLGLTCSLGQCINASGGGAGGGSGGGTSGGLGGGTGGGSGGGTAGGTAGGTGGGSATLTPAECQAQCHTILANCGVTGTSADSMCNGTCANTLTQDQATCIAGIPCATLLASGPGSCLTGGGAGGGSGGGFGGGSAGGSAGGSGGGSSGNPCAIPTENLLVTFPWTNSSPLVVVNVPGYPNPTCIRSGTGGNYTGYSIATATQVFYDNSSNLSVQNLGPLFYVDFLPEERALSSGERSSIASATGIPLALVPTGDRLVSSTTVTPTLVGTPLPSGVSLEVFIASSTSGGSRIRFSSTSATTLTGFFQGPLATGVTVQAGLRPFIGTGTWTAQFRLRSSTPYLTLTSLSQP